VQPVILRGPGHVNLLLLAGAQSIFPRTFEAHQEDGISYLVGNGISSCTTNIFEKDRLSRALSRRWKTTQFRTICFHSPRPDAKIASSDSRLRRYWTLRCPLRRSTLGVTASLIHTVRSAAKFVRRPGTSSATAENAAKTPS
jgi:hypothetical protein